jgi:hypothetical protein
MRRLRLEQQSIYYAIKDILHKEGFNTLDEGSQADIYRTELPYYVKVMAGFPDVYKVEITLPSIVVEHVRTSEAGLQIGGGWKVNRTWSIDIYASRDGERDDLMEIIYEGFDQTTRLRDFNIAFPDYEYVGGVLVEHFGGVVPNALSDLDFMTKSQEQIPRTSPAEIDSHRARILVRTLSLR